MATYLELQALSLDSDLNKRTETAVVIAAQGLIEGASPTANDRRWARQALYTPAAEAAKALRFVLAKNKAVAPATIQAVTDANLQTQVQAVVPALVLAMAGA
jgi:hypothetical protein